MRAPSTDREAVLAEVPGGGAGRPTVATIDLDALAHNYAEVCARIRGRKVLAMVKAQAYGHGAVAVSRRLADLGVAMFGVALVEEGIELRRAGISQPILVMSPVFPGQAEAVIEAGLTPVVFNAPLARALSEAAVKAGVSQPVHVKVDTGMGRLGMSPEDAADLVPVIAGLPGIVVEGVMTHFADADLRDKQFAAAQMDRFEKFLRAIEERGVSVPLRHAANSAAVLEYDRALFTMVRPGIMLYGCNPLESGVDAGLRPVLSLRTRIAFLKKLPAGTPVSYGRTFVTKRESLIATVPLGYADGYRRGLSNRGEMLVRGQRAAVAGRVCMDMTMLDVTDVPGVAEGDDVVAIGSQEKERITADEIASRTGTISYEVLCGISSRVPRSYV
ncbi:MAG: alanine racemase [Nitrospirota bacterium]|nr:alanine racemase [Nitrospirota bacterium]